ncbi:MAG TPA: GWxTD domain-containing protein [Candidatus Aminicenantes bacterium]|nr:GWxTD domain-containing protein [Candidatus Aminicenantes bacterium]
MSASVKRLALAAAVVLGASSCASERLPRTFDPASREFYSKVRYIITAEERKAFLALPEADRPAFIEDFWARRDPKPGTEENEFKTEYFKRIDTANRLFSGGAAPGWLQDRGRVYIVLGPPDYRETYPRGITFYGLPTEIWWYGFFTITFIDERWIDDYRFAPDSAAQIAMIERAGKEWNEPRIGFTKEGTAAARSMSGLDVRIETAGGEGTRFTVALPYPSIWMKARGETLETALDVTMTVRDAAGAEAWSFAKSYPLEVAVSRLRETAQASFTAEASASLAPGSYTLTVTVVNAHDGSQASLERAFEVGG